MKYNKSKNFFLSDKSLIISKAKYLNYRTKA